MSEATMLRGQRFIGQRLPRKEDARLLTGKGSFVDDIVLPGMLHVAFVRSPIARGRILSIDRTVAREQPGVQAVLTQADLARFDVTMMTYFMGPAEVAMTPLAGDHVAYVGHPVAMVVADDRYLAEDAASLVQVDYAEEPAVVTIADARHGPPVHPDTDDNVAALMGEEDANAELEEQLRHATHLVTRSVTHQRVAQSPMETRGVVAALQGEEELLVHITCASPHLVQRWLTLALGVPQMSIRVVAKDVGGSFGLKNHPWLEEVSAILAAMILRRPVKWIEDRIENLTASNQAREQEITMRVGFDANGRLVAGHADYSLNNGAYPMGADANIAVHMFMWAAYNMPAYSFISRGFYSNTQGLAAYRGPWAIETLARETLLDAAARQIGIDPIEIRRRNLCTAADQPSVTALGIPREDITPAQCLDALLEVVDIRAFRREQAAARTEGRHLGIGFAAYIEPTGAAGSIGVMTGELAQVRVDPVGRIIATMSVHSQGHGTQTTMAQCIAEAVGVRFEDVTIFDGDSARGGFSPGAGGSRQGVIGGGAAIRAGRLLADKIRMIAAHLLNASPADIVIEDGIVHVTGAPAMTRSLREIAEIAYGEPSRLPPGMESGLEVQYRYDPPPMTFTSAAHACIVEVDVETGFVTIRRWVSSEDCGVMINPAVVEGQIAGGLAQAIGSVLLEEAGYDARGNPIAATFKDYLLPTIFDVPDIEYVHANTPSQAEGGFRGVGEGGCIIGPPTLVNAIADALTPFGDVPVDLPLTPSKILAIVEGQAWPERPLSRFHPDWVDPGAPSTSRSSTANGAEAAPTTTAPPSPTQPASIPVGIDGAWRLTLATPMGPQSMMAHFHSDGLAVHGRLESDQGGQDFAGSISGNQVKWEMKVTKPMSITLKYDLLFDGDSVRGKCKMGIFGTAKVSGTRA
ncbi:xanthine dehydrogenase family protein molybdopterin-binding subunit [Sphingobium sp. AP49]|uniref:xanthine dehydrogenase family protein molybdopterin-binding subunit n=1 Tax=Sphingobium sp. AP49 TaxID=1144307 RepID=UPI00026ED187|nr:xanthine dehydrogenase family protein molybdopterin-binding subunit [Sphingobium sp. AP49]WHO38767.1 xanthine dehydrogenase family protein molybdopterin-binding subunit [Sphingobium sp. AP49]